MLRNVAAEWLQMVGGITVVCVIRYGGSVWNEQDKVCLWSRIVIVIGKGRGKEEGGGAEGRYT